MRWPDLQTADGLLKQQSDGPPVGVWRDSADGFVCRLDGGQRRVMHQFEIVKVQPRPWMLGCECRSG